MVSRGRSPQTLDNYRQSSHDLLAVGERAMAQGELVQASEKFWGAAAQMVKAVAEQRGWEHAKHYHLFQAVSRLSTEENQADLRGLFLAAGQLHTNFYEDWLPADMVAYGGEQVNELIRRLEALL